MTDRGSQPAPAAPPASLVAAGTSKGSGELAGVQALNRMGPLQSGNSSARNCCLSNAQIRVDVACIENGSDAMSTDKLYEFRDYFTVQANEWIKGQPAEYDEARLACLRAKVAKFQPRAPDVSPEDIPELDLKPAELIAECFQIYCSSFRSEAKVDRFFREMERTLE